MAKTQKELEAHVESFDETVASTHVPRFFLQLSHDEASELSFGRVPDEVREKARLLADETQEDLRKNAAKPVTARHRPPQ